MSFSPSDNQFAVCVNTVAGTTDATPTMLIFPHEESNNINYTSNWLDSPNVKPNRGSAGGKNTSFSTTGSLSCHLSRNDAVDVLLASGFSGTWEADELKGGATDTALTIEKRMGVSGARRYHRVAGSQVSKVNFNAKASANCMVSFDSVGMNFESGSAVITGATYPPIAQTNVLAGPDCAVTIAGQTLDYIGFSLDVEFDRSAQFKLNSNAARGIGTAGYRKVSGEIEFFMPTTDYYAALLDPNGLNLQIQMGAGANGYLIIVPAAQFKVPEDSADGSAMIVKAQFSGANTVADGTNIILNRLAA